MSEANAETSPTSKASAVKRLVMFFRQDDLIPIWLTLGGLQGIWVGDGVMMMLIIQTGILFGIWKAVKNEKD